MGVKSVLTAQTAREFLRNRSYILAFATIGVLLVGTLYVVGARLLLEPLALKAASGSLDGDLMIAAGGGLVYCTGLIVAGLFLNISATQPMIRAKATGMVEAILAAPAEPGDLWTALSLAAVIPGLAIALCAGLVGAAAIQLVYFTPFAVSVFGPWTIVNCFVLLPAMYLALSFLVHAISLPGRASSGAVIAQVFFPVYTSLVINLGARDVLAVGRPDLAGVQVGITGLFFLLAALRSRALTKERIVVSCRA